jgi:hypothetical protein
MDVYSATPQVRHIIENVFASPCQVLFNVKDALGILILIYSSMRSVINSIPDFRILTENEQCSLFQRNLTGITNLYSVLVFSDTGIINNSDYIKSFTLVYGIEMMLQLTYINKLLNIDFTTIKLMLIILAFSSNYSTVDVHEMTFNDSLLHGTHRLLGSQNVYVEVLWKYMVYQYGYYDSALRFAQLIEFLLNLIKSSTYAYINNTTYHNLVNDVIQKSKQWLITNQNEQVPLWGKI